MEIQIPFFKSDNNLLNDACRIAIGDLLGNVAAYQDGLLDKPAACLMAGLDYPTPWTRDAAINVLNAMSLLSPEISKNTLLSVLISEGGKPYIGGQYWDAIIWLIGAYQYCSYTADPEFFRLAYEAGKNSMRHYEKNEFDHRKGLFRGPAVYGDGVAAYPDKYARCPSNSSSILDWIKLPENNVCPHGYGIPMFALSTNCIYFRAYEILGTMAEILKEPAAEYKEKARQLCRSVNREFWNESRGNYDYLAEECDYNEGMGLAFAILFGISGKEQTGQICRNTHITPHGIPCVWPTFPRYGRLGGYGRHSGTIWPHIQGFWALAMKKAGREQDFERELYLMAQKAVRDMHFSEIYHPCSGMPYGGLQEDLLPIQPDGNALSSPGTACGIPDSGIREWPSMRKQSWSASAFLSLIFYGIAGLSIENGSPVFHPYLPEGCEEIVLQNINLCGRQFRIVLQKGQPPMIQSQ